MVGKASFVGMLAVRWHCTSSSRVRPLSSRPKTSASVCVSVSDPKASASDCGVKSTGVVRPRDDVVAFFFNDTATTEIYTLSLHDALPIYRLRRDLRQLVAEDADRLGEVHGRKGVVRGDAGRRA